MHISNRATYFVQALVLLCTHQDGNEDAEERLVAEETKRFCYCFPAIYSQMVLLEVTRGATFSCLYLDIGQ